MMIGVKMGFKEENLSRRRIYQSVGGPKHRWRPFIVEVIRFNLMYELAELKGKNLI